MDAPKVFMSYSRESRTHEAWVLNLAASLRRNGVDARLDQWDLKPGSDMTMFMESQIRDSDFVVLVCTPTYAKKSNIPSGGVGYEKNIISAEMLQSRDLRPKFIPILRDGNFDSSLPTYLGSKYAIDFRPERDDAAALDELLRAIHEVPPLSKPPIIQSPFAQSFAAQGPSSMDSSGSSTLEPTEISARTIDVAGDVESWRQRAFGRFKFLRQARIVDDKVDPFVRGYWQASFALRGRLRAVTLAELLEIQRNSKTNRTGWDIGWVPTRPEIAPYPFQDGIEVWLAEGGGKGPAHSDFWRVEKIGTFSLFRGYQEDEEGFAQRHPGIQLDYSLVLWRVSEVLLFIESFANNIGASDLAANLCIEWTGLESRSLGHHNELGMEGEAMCRQSSVKSKYIIPNTAEIKRSLVQDVHQITRPLLEVFNFFVLTEAQVKALIKRLFDADKEST